MRLLVTGAAGFLGSHVCEALIARGDEVVGVDNFDPFYERAVKEANLAQLKAGPRFRLLEADVRQVSVMARELTPETTIVHLAARAGVRPSIADPGLYAQLNVEGTVRVLEAMRLSGARRLVYASSSSVYGDSAPVPFREDWPCVEPISPYAATKRASELLCATWAYLYDFRVMALRFFTIYGPRQRPDLAIHIFTRLITQNRPVPMFGDGSTERDYTYVGDTVQGVLGAVDWVADAAPAFQIVNLGESQTVRLDRLVDLVGRAVGREPVIDWRPMQPGDVRRTCADITKARNLLGFRPCVSVDEGIPRFVQWYEETYGRQS